MKHQKVSVDYWSMFLTMITYGVLSILCWVMIRLFYAVFTLPRRLRSQQRYIQNTVKELRKRFPDLNITEEDLENPDINVDELLKKPNDEDDAHIGDETKDIQTEEKNKDD